MLKNLISIVILLVISCSLYAQTERRIENDPAAQKILDEVSTKYHSSASMKVNFSLLVDSPQDEVYVQSSGTVALKDEMYKIDTEDMTIICDNVKRYVYLKESNELQINYFEPEEDEIESPSELFDIYKKNYFYRTIGGKMIEGKKLTMIELIPDDITKSPYKRIFLYVDENQAIISKAEIHGKDGVMYTYNIKNMQEDVQIEDQEFSFDPSKYPGIYVDDMTK